MKTIVTIALVFLFAQLAFGQEKQSPPADEKVVFEKKTIIDFSELLIQGNWVSPEGTYMKTRRKNKAHSLIDLRSNFRPELERSINEL